MDAARQKAVENNEEIYFAYVCEEEFPISKEQISEMIRNPSHPQGGYTETPAFEDSDLLERFQKCARLHNRFAAYVKESGEYKRVVLSSDGVYGFDPCHKPEDECNEWD